MSEPAAGRLAVLDTVAEGTCALTVVGATGVVLVVIGGLVVVVGGLVVVLVVELVVVGATAHCANRVTLADNVMFDAAAILSPVPSDAVFHPVNV